MESFVQKWFEKARDFDIIFYMHGNGAFLAGKEFASTLTVSNPRVGINNKTGCLCNYKKNDWDFEEPKMAVIHTLNGAYHNKNASTCCANSNKKIILDNPNTEFWAMDFGDSDFRKVSLGEAPNLFYLKDYNVRDFFRSAHSLRR